MNSIELKVKAKSLADEARTIRKEERKLINAHQGDTFNREKLYHHRVGPVRRAARATHLARAFLSQRPYRTVEGPRTRTEPPLYAVLKMVKQYGHRDYEMADLIEWVDPARASKVA